MVKIGDDIEVKRTSEQLQTMDDSSPNSNLADRNGRSDWNRDRLLASLEIAPHVSAELKKTLVDFVRRVLETPPATDDVPLLTDDFAPVDTMVF